MDRLISHAPITGGGIRTVAGMSHAGFHMNLVLTGFCWVTVLILKLQL